MIPKVIHYCWFGTNELPDNYKKCIMSWQKYCPDYEIKRWDENTFDVECSTFAKEAYYAKKWAFVSDYARLKIIYDEGGIYLDVDVELVKNLDPFLCEKCFLGEETSGYVNTGLGFGAEKGSSIVKKMLEEYSDGFIKDNGEYDAVPCPRKNTNPLLPLGYRYSGKNVWRNENVTVFPPKYFCPLDYETGKISIEPDTVSIHHFSASWLSDSESKIMSVHRFCIRHFGLENGNKIGSIIDVPYKTASMIEKYGIKKTIIKIANQVLRNKRE